MPVFDTELRKPIEEVNGMEGFRRARVDDENAEASRDDLHGAVRAVCGDGETGEGKRVRATAIENTLNVRRQYVREAAEEVILSLVNKRRSTRGGDGVSIKDNVVIWSRARARPIHVRIVDLRSGRKSDARGAARIEAARIDSVVGVAEGTSGDGVVHIARPRVVKRRRARQCLRDGAAGTSQKRKRKN